MCVPTPSSSRALRLSPDQQKMVKQMADGPLKKGDLIVCQVIGVTSGLAQVAYKGLPGVIRSPVAARSSIGDRLKSIVTEVNVGGRFEAALLNSGDA
jgi:hypothetical protein